MSNLYLKIFPIALSITAWGMHAQAQETCDCVVGVPGNIESATAGVQVSGVDGLVAAEAGTVLGSGSQMIVGAGSAQVNFGTTCEVALIPANTELTVSPLDNAQLCVRLSSQVATTVPETAAQITPASVLLSIGAIGGIVCAVEECWDGDNGGGKKPVSN